MENRVFIEREMESFLEMITDDELREKTIDCWVIAMEEGRKSYKDITAMPFTVMTDNKGISILEHTKAVTAGAFALYEAMAQTYNELPFDVDRNWLIAGGLLHEVGKCIEIENDAGLWMTSKRGRCSRHPILGAMLATRAGLPDEVVNIIACHSQEGKGQPKRIETIFIEKVAEATFDPMFMMDRGMLIR